MHREREIGLALRSEYAGGGEPCVIDQRGIGVAGPI